MAKIEKSLVINLINAQRQKGMTDKEIFDKLARRKDGLGDNVRTLIGRYEDDESPDAKEDTAKFFGLDITQVKGNSQQGSGNKNATIGDKLKSYAVSTATGIGNVGAGMLQPIAIAGDTVNKGINKVLGTNLETNAEARVRADNKALNAYSDKQRLKANRKGGDAPRLIGEIGASLPAFMYGAGGSTMGARVADQAVRGAAVGGLQLTQEGSDPNQRLYNMAGGAVGGAVGQAGGELIGAGASKVIGKAVNAKRGKLKPKYQEVDNLGKQYDVPTTVGDIKGGGSIKNIETQLERVPVVGISKLRTTQHDRSLAAATGVSKKFKNLMDETDYKAIPAMQRAAQQGDRNASRVLGIINDAGNDTGKILQASAEVKGWRQSAIATKLYNRVDDEVIKAGNGTVPTNRTQAALADALDKQAASLAPDGILLRELTKISDNLANPSKPKTFKNTRLLRSQLGDLADKYGSPINGNKAAARVFGDIKKAVDDDIADFAANSGNTAIKTAYKKADKFYAGVMKSKDSAITKAMQSNKPDEVFDKFIKAGKGDAAQNFANSLDDKGRAALRYQMVDDAMTKAWNENKEAFSPAKFAGKFEELAEPYTRLFKGDDKKQMDGFIKLMRHVERAGQFKENPPTGVRLGDVAMVGTALANAPLAIKGASVSLLARTLFTTKAGKNLLLAADNLPPSQQVALDNIMKIATKLASSSGSKQGRETAERVAGTKVSDKESESLTAF